LTNIISRQALMAERRLRSRLYEETRAMSGNSKLVYNVSNNGANGDWYWEVITPEREIMARGMASSSAQARADALRAGAAYACLKNFLI
jgi:hypothetical protein